MQSEMINEYFRFVFFSHCGMLSGKFVSLSGFSENFQGH